MNNFPFNYSFKCYVPGKIGSILHMDLDLFVAGLVLDWVFLGERGVGFGDF